MSNGQQNTRENNLPLRDIRIVDLTMGWSGPLATRHLADMGAEVIKIEACKYPDWWRGWEHTTESLAANEHEKGPAFNEINRNKLGVAIDLTRPEGRDLALRMVERADAVIENQATGVMTKLGLSYEDLREVNPELIMLSLPGFGTTGPWSAYRAYGSTVEHCAGLPLLSGEENGPPVQLHVAYGDACGGLHAVSALLVALFHRKRTGKGQRVDLAQVECMLQLGAHGPITYGLTGEAPPRTGNRHPTFVPHGCFACTEPDSWLIVSIQDGRQWRALCEALGRADLRDDASLSTAQGRRERESEIEAAVSAWTAACDNDAAMHQLQNAGVPAAAVLRPSELLEDPGFRDRGFWVEVDRAIVGAKPHPVTPWRYNGERAPIRWPTPTLGEHNHTVLRDLLGMNAEEVEQLEADGVIGTVPIAKHSRPGAVTATV